MVMLDKKDPGKFTVRFNPADPQQRTVIGLLNQQGRYKAQFLTNAILHYIHCPETPDVMSAPAAGSGEVERIERIVRNVLAQQQASPPQEPVQPSAGVAPPWEEPASKFSDTKSQEEDADRDAIFRTLDAFRPKQ